MRERDDRRIDLDALCREDPAQTERVVQATMARIAARRREPTPLLAELAGWWRAGMAAAAATVLLAAGVVWTHRTIANETGPATAEARLLDDAASGRVP